MFMFKKIVTPFLLPPGIFIVVLLLAGIWAIFKRKSWKLGVLNVLIAVSGWLLSISPVTDGMLRGLESGFKIPANLQGDVIILLGGGANDNAPDFSGKGAPSDEMMSRIVTAVRIQKKLDVPIIVSGGSVFEGVKSEAPIDGRFLKDLGVPQDKIILEDKSRDTIENAKFTRDICEKHKFANPILVTSAYHMRRSMLSFQKVDMKATPFPEGFKTLTGRRYKWFDYLPGDFNSARAAFHEYAGLLFYKIAY